MKKIPINEAPESVNPRCHSCAKELTELWVKSKGWGFVEQTQIVMCPHCHVVLGYGTLGR